MFIEPLDQFNFFPRRPPFRSLESLSSFSFVLSKSVSICVNLPLNPPYRLRCAHTTPPTIATATGMITITSSSIFCN